MKSYQITIAIIIVIKVQIDGQETNCGRRLVHHTSFIANGFQANVGDWPWHSAIYHASICSFTYKCGGTVLSSNAILTAAHCIFENDQPIIPDRILVYLAKHNLKNIGTFTKEFQVYKMIPHPNFSTSDLSNDIAIIRLSTEITFNDYIQPICLWDSNKVAITEVIGNLGTVVGWGVTETSHLSPILRYASMPVVSTLTCLASNRNFFGTFLSETNFCAGFRNGTGACSGDSGSSLSFEENGIYRIRGIVSLGVSQKVPGLCNAKEYVVFTDVAKYLTWIEEVVPQLKQSVSKSEDRRESDGIIRTSGISHDEPTSTVTSYQGANWTGNVVPSEEGQRGRNGTIRAGGLSHDELSATSYQGANRTGNVVPSKAFRLAASAEVFMRQIRLYINDADKIAYAEISNGDPTDEIWMDLSFDGGSNFEGNLGRAAIPVNFRSVRTTHFSLQNGRRDGVLRAGGKAGNRVEVALTSWEGANSTGNVVPSEAFRLAASAEVFWRQIRLYINDADKTAYAEISNGDPTDEVWVDLSFDGGSNFEGNLGRAAIAANSRSVRTTDFSLQNGGRGGVLRAGGKAGNRVEVALTSWEGANSTRNVEAFRLAASAEVFWRQIRLYINDADKTAYAEISNGDPTDEVWMDLSFDGGSNFEGNLGRSAIAANYRSARTTHFSLQNGGRSGVLRAGGKAGNRVEIALTSWESASSPGNVVPSEAFRLAASAEVFWRQIRLYVNDANKTAYAEISNGDPTDEVWMDLSFDGGSNFEGNLGRAAIAANFRSVRTTHFSLQNGRRDGVLRAGGKAGNRVEVALTSWEGANSTGNVVPPEAFRLAASAEVFMRQIRLYINDADKTAYGEISNGDPTDEVWMDLSFDGGSNFEGNLGRAAIAANSRSVRTTDFSLQNGRRDGVLRVGGKAGNRVEVAVTSWEGANFTGSVVPSEAFRLAASAEVFWRQIRLYINDADKTAYAAISNGDPTDEVWMDLSFDGGSNFEGNLGRAAIAANSRSVRTTDFSLQNGGRGGVLRAGGKAGNRVEIALTSWEGAN